MVEDPEFPGQRCSFGPWVPECCFLRRTWDPIFLARCLPAASCCHYCRLEVFEIRYYFALHFHGSWVYNHSFCDARCPVCKGMSTGARRLMGWKMDRLEERQYFLLDDERWDGYDFREFPWSQPDSVVNGVNWDYLSNCPRYPPFRHV